MDIAATLREFKFFKDAKLQLKVRSELINTNFNVINAIHHSSR